MFKNTAGVPFYLKMGLLCAFMVYMGAVVPRPYRTAARMEAENARLERRLREERQAIQDLRKKVTALSTDAGMERAARERGYLKPGEAPLQVAGHSKK